MRVNNNRTDLWKSDTMASVDYYNKWFMDFAPKAFREARNGVIEKDKNAMRITDDFKNISPANILDNPETLSTLRMATAPPLAIDRLAGLSRSASSFIKRIDKEHDISHLKCRDEQATRIAIVICQMLDKDIMPWIERGNSPQRNEKDRCASIIADRLTGSLADPIIRNEQEKRQLKAIETYLKAKGYVRLSVNEVKGFKQMPKKSFAFHLNIPVKNLDGSIVNLPPDVVITDNGSAMPLFVECKSAGDYTNTNKRRKEEAQKMSQLRATYGENVRYILFLCGYFDTSYLGYEAAEGIDWIWEHRIEDFDELGI